jgi:hypothetical protein
MTMTSEHVEAEARRLATGLIGEAMKAAGWTVYDLALATRQSTTTVRLKLSGIVPWSDTELLCAAREMGLGSFDLIPTGDGS